MSREHLRPKLPSQNFSLSREGPSRNCLLPKTPSRNFSLSKLVRRLSGIVLFSEVALGSPLWITLVPSLDHPVQAWVPRPGSPVGGAAGSPRVTLDSLHGRTWITLQKLADPRLEDHFRNSTPRVPWPFLRERSLSEAMVKLSEARLF